MAREKLRVTICYASRGSARESVIQAFVQYLKRVLPWPKS